MGEGLQRAIAAARATQKVSRETTSLHPKHPCAKRIRDKDTSWAPTYHACSRPGVVEEGGKWWCRQHSQAGATARDKRRAETQEAWLRRYLCRTPEHAGFADLLALASKMVAYEDERTENTGIIDTLEAWVSFVDQARAALLKCKGGTP